MATDTLKKMTSPSDPANPLLSMEFRVPFDRIRAEHVEPAIAELLREARARLEAIAAEPAGRTFENTMRALDTLTEPLDCAMAVVRHLESVATYPELRAAFNAVQPEVSAFYSRHSPARGAVARHQGVRRHGRSRSAGGRAAALPRIRPSTPSAATAPTSTPPASSAWRRSTSS